MEQLHAAIAARAERVAALMATRPVTTVLFVDARRQRVAAEYRVWRRADLTEQAAADLLAVGAHPFRASDWRDPDFEDDFEPEVTAALAAGVARGEAFMLLRRRDAGDMW